MRWLDGITDSGHEFEQALGVGEGQESLQCCSPWGHKELDTTWRLENNNLKHELECGQQRMRKEKEERQRI